MNIPYETFPKTYVKKSCIKNAGIGLFTKKKLKKYDWIGFYPGIIDNIENIVGDVAYMMGTRKPNIIISADGNIKKGVHLINEGNNCNLPNVFYVKLDPITDENKCTDPRCIKMNNCCGTHRNKSLFHRGWKKKLREKKPRKFKNFDIL